MCIYIKKIFKADSEIRHLDTTVPYVCRSNFIPVDTHNKINRHQRYQVSHKADSVMSYGNLLSHFTYQQSHYR